MARKRGGLRTSVYQGADHWSILFRNGQYCDLGVRYCAILAELFHIAVYWRDDQLREGKYESAGLTKLW
jgi:hypothetical protein